MGKFKYLIYRKSVDIKRAWRRYLVYILIFYIGLLLPAFSWAHSSGLKHNLKYLEIKDVNQSVLATWFSDSFEPSIFAKYNLTALNVFKLISLPDESMVTLMGIVSHKEKLSLKEGRNIEDSDVEGAKNVCVINAEHAKKFNRSLGDKIQLQDKEYEIIGITADFYYRNVIYIPITSFDENIMRGDEKYQFRGVFKCADDESSYELGLSLQEELRKNGIPNSRFTEGKDYWKNANQTINRSRNQQVAIAIGGTIFFLINSTIVLLGKMNDEKKNIAIRIVMGASPYTELASSFLETILVGGIAAFLSLISLKPLAKLVMLDDLIHIDIFTVLGLSFSTSLTIIGINIFLLYKFNQLNLPTLLNSGE